MTENYKIEIKRSAIKEIKSLPNIYLTRVLEKISSLSINPRPNGCKKLTGQNKYRVRVGPYRILYTIEEKRLVIIVVKVANRKEVYN